MQLIFGIDILGLGKNKILIVIELIDCLAIVVVDNRAIVLAGVSFNTMSVTSTGYQGGSNSTHLPMSNYQ